MDTGLFYVKGDVTATNQKMIVQGCNAQGVMGSGVAAAIRKKWPKVYEVYHYQWREDLAAGRRHMTLGSIVPVKVDDVWIVNAITQEFFGTDGKKYVSYDAIDEAMGYALRLANKLGIDHIAMPMIGSGLGGGKWSVISAIIKETLAAYKKVTIYQL